MRSNDVTADIERYAPDQTPTRLIEQIVLLVMGSTLLSVVLFRVLAPELRIANALVGAAPFAMLYGSSLILGRMGWPRLAAHLFVWVTIVLQFMVTVLSPEADSQALVSYVNVVMSAGFMLGQRWALLACITATGLVATSVYAGEFLRQGLLRDMYARTLVYALSLIHI